MKWDTPSVCLDAIASSIGRTVLFMITFGTAIAIGLIANEVSPHGWGMLYLLFVFPADLATHLIQPLGALAAVISVVFAVRYLYREETSSGTLLIFWLSMSLFVFRSVGATQQSQGEGSWVVFVTCTGPVVGLWLLCKVAQTMIGTQKHIDGGQQRH